MNFSSFHLSNSRLAILGIVAAVILFFILIFSGFIPGLRQDLGPTTHITVWGVHDTASEFNRAVSAFSASNPNVVVSYTAKNPTTYENDLINALAVGQAPDIVFIHNTWLKKHGNKLAPAPLSIIAPNNLYDIFPDVVPFDFVSNGRVYALPLYIDTLALYYNTDHFNSANIISPPETWEEFLEAVLLTKSVNLSTGEINRAGAALGGSRASIPRSPDILSLLMMQAGTVMTNESTTAATFANTVGGVQVGQNALEFYTRFSNPSSRYYTWSDNIGNSRALFAQGQVSMIIDYAHARSEIENLNPFVRFRVAKVPQISGSDQVNFADYWGLAVLSQSRNSSLAWHFINSITTDRTAALNYYRASSRPPALRSLLPQCQANPNLSAFCLQTLSSRSWRQPDKSQIDIIFSNMISDVINGRFSIREALAQAQSRVSPLMR